MVIYRAIGGAVEAAPPMSLNSRLETYFSGHPFSNDGLQLAGGGERLKFLNFEQLMMLIIGYGA